MSMPFTTHGIMIIKLSKTQESFHESISEPQVPSKASWFLANGNYYLTEPSRQVYVSDMLVALVRG